ncbi:MAG: SGNH/GDSL hydrolase family protein [Candidatus Heimdallarchaeota archaeon]|nr:SGNH/GDSL hydrolase family protein [Candidatus Heimdallarchaeota archaeon]
MKTIYYIMIIVLGIIIFLIALILLTYKIFLNKIYQRPKNNPIEFLKKKKERNSKKPKRKRIVFVGDSLTHGNLSSNYIELVAEKIGEEKFEYINAGINAHTTYNILERIENIIACDPDFIIVLIGTNDANREIELYNNILVKRVIELPRKPTKKWFTENLMEIGTRLKKETNAKIAICSIPPVGEDPKHKAFKQSVEYSRIIKEIAIKLEVSYLPVNEKMLEYLKENSPKPKYPVEQRLVEKTAMKHFLLGKSLDKISKEHGFELLIDHVHLNTKGATMIAKLIVEFLKAEEKRLKKLDSRMVLS